jgi:anti-anti-sigma factor
MDTLEVRYERDAAAGVEIVAPHGEIDLSNLEILDRALDEVLRQSPRRLLVDLSGLEYMDSAGISSLLRAGKQMSQKGGRLILVGGSRFIQRLLRMTGLDRLFRHYETAAAALAAEAIDEGETIVPQDPGGASLPGSGGAALSAPHSKR